MIKIIPLGGAEDIGASCIYLNISGTGIMLDCGIHPKKKGTNALPKFDLIENLPLDYVFVSHAHQDHIGALPYLIKKFPHVIIYTTPQTQEIAALTLHNAVSILEKESKDDILEPYTHEEIDLLVKSMNAVDYNDEIDLKGIRHKSDEMINVYLYDAGHILGSASILVTFKEHSIFYTGDIKLSPQSVMNGAELPSKKVNTIITETTYGSISSSSIASMDEESAKFAKECNKIIRQGGSILIPVFALGKMQEILTLIYNLMKKGKLTDMPIYTGGLGPKISKVYDKSRFVVKRKEKDLELSQIEQIDLYDIKDYQHFVRNPGIVIASSGMILENTTSYQLVKFWLKQQKFAVFFVGYIDEDTPGYQVLNSSENNKVKLTDFEEEIISKCSIERFNFPSHSTRNELLRIIQKYKPDNIILVHGEESSRDWMGYNILKSFPNSKVYAPGIGSEIVI